MLGLCYAVKKLSKLTPDRSTLVRIYIFLTLEVIVASLVLTKLDYGNATLAGVPAHQIHRLQAVMNAAARLIFHTSRHDHITPLLRRLHWLQWRSYRPCRPCSAGGPRSSKGPSSNPLKKIFWCHFLRTFVFVTTIDIKK
jgi:hypothetical protein